jgi:hypothetical protein
MRNRFKFLSIIVIALCLFGVHPASAQDANPPANNAWSEVVNPNGSINYDGMTDNGVVSQPADFMPSIPGVGSINAEYHAYTTSSGNQVLMPTTTTLFFMSMDKSSLMYTNPTMGTAGLSAASSNDGSSMVGTAFVGKAFGYMLGTTDASDFGGSQKTGNFFSDLISGKQNLWEFAPSGITNLLGSFYKQSLQDKNLYTYMILVPPGACGGSPAGCTPQQLALQPPVLPIEEADTLAPPVIGECPPPLVIPGKISFGGSKNAPEYPLVVGQDPGRRGVDLEFSASVAPTKYITYKKVLDVECVQQKKGNCKPQVVGFHCEQKVQMFDECIASANGSAHLTEESRAWILDELSIRYPGAYLHQPDFGFSSDDCSWSDTEERVPFADPGHWDLSVSGSTSGTPVSGPRGFGGQVDNFEVWLKEIAIIK